MSDGRQEGGNDVKGGNGLIQEGNTVLVEDGMLICRTLGTQMHSFALEEAVWFDTGYPWELTKCKWRFLGREDKESGVCYRYRDGEVEMSLALWQEMPELRMQVSYTNRGSKQIASFTGGDIGSGAGEE